MLRLKFDIDLIEDNYTKEIYLEWFKDYGVDWKNVVWVADVKYKNSFQVFVKDEKTGRELYTQMSYFHLVVPTKELSEWL